MTADGQQAGVAAVPVGSRGVGRGIAIALGSHGYTVYVTGQTQRTGESPWDGTIHDTATAITAAGGKGVAGCRARSRSGRSHWPRASTCSRSVSVAASSPATT